MFNLKFTGIIKVLLQGFLTILLCIVNVYAESDTSVVSISQPAAWIEPVPFVYPDSLPEDELSGGEYHLLVDRQFKWGTLSSRYSRFVSKMIDEKGIESSSQISPEIDPAFEKLIFHKIVIWRGDKEINKLDLSKIKVIQRETDMDYLIYDGRVTASIILDDVRVGDILEYAYTVTGQNPAFDGNFSFALSLNWSVPVHKISYVLYAPADMKLITSGINTESVFEAKKEGDFNVIRISDENIPAYLADSQAPKWYTQYSYAHISSMAAWADVVDFVQPFYSLEGKNNSRVKVEADRISKNNASVEEKVASALHYVQKNIRYLGIEAGAGSYIPNDPQKILERLFGDCKDKTFLLMALLNEMGIKSYPALVNTKFRKGIKNYLPSIKIFNHVLLTLEINNKRFWLDPTITYQKGALGTFYQPDYGYALVLSDSTPDLVAMKNDFPVLATEVYEEIDLRTGIDKEALYKITTVYSGKDADDFRYRLASSGKNKIEKNYYDFASKFYPSIQKIKGIIINDNEENNTITIKEEYKVPEMWEDNKEKERLKASFYSTAVYGNFSNPKIRKRKAPYSINFPFNATHKIDVLLPEEWSIENSTYHEKNSFFEYDEKISYDPGQYKLSLYYKYKTLRDYVNPDEIDEYIRKSEDTESRIDYYVYNNYGKPAEESDGAKDDDDLSTVLIIILLIIFLAGIFYSVIEFVKDSKKNAKLTSEYFPVSVFKFIFMMVFSLNFYLIYWYYKNWKFIKLRDKSSVVPVLRSLFSVFFYYSFFKNLMNDNQKIRNNEFSIISGSQAVFLYVILILFTLTKTASYFYMLSFLCFLPFVTYIYNINKSNPESIEANSQYRVRHAMMFIISSILLVLVAASEFHYIPAYSVIKGEKIWSVDKSYLIKTDMLEIDESILYFYSNAFISIKNEGNFYTDKGIVSYWRDEVTEILNIEKAGYDDVEDISVNYGRRDDDTVIKVIRKDKTSFKLVVTNEEKEDRVFAKTLVKTWRNHEKS